MEAVMASKGHLLMDGALGTELEKGGQYLDPILWSASVLIEAPGQIYDLHRSYLNAGADCLTTSTYQLSYEGGARLGLGTEEVDELFRRASLLAFSAVHSNNLSAGLPARKAFVAAGLGAYGASLANGAEYIGDYEISNRQISDYHHSRVQASVVHHPDVLLFETIPSCREAIIIVDLMNGYADIPYWLSFQCASIDRIADGTSIADVVGRLEFESNLRAIGVNCVPPQLVTGAVRAFQKTKWSRDLIVYPNRGGAYDGTTKTWKFGSAPRDLAGLYVKWNNMGVRILGGCCGLGPGHIKTVADALASSN